MHFSFSVTHTHTASRGGGSGNASANTAASSTDVHTHKHQAQSEREGDEAIVHRCPPSILPVQLPILSENKPSVSDPGPIRSETEAHWLTREAARFHCGSCDRLLTPAVTADLRCLPLSLVEPKGTCVHTQTHPPLFSFAFPHPIIPQSPFSPPSLFPFFFIFCFFIKRCCLRYYLCYTNQINRRHFSFKG